MNSNIRTRLAIVLVGSVALSIWSGCQTAPVSGRKQLLLSSETKEVEMGRQAYAQILEEEKPSTNQRYVSLVERVGNRIAAVSGRPDYAWEFKVIESDQQNAFCLPGGKVAVYEGMIPICENEAGLAVVMSHEVAHALARHGGERMTHGRVENGAKQIGAYLMRDVDETKQQIILTAYGAGAKYGVILPYSRKHESEADSIGLKLMAEAGYDPSEAPRFWERFGGSKDGDSPPEFMSTHPSDARRATELREQVPDVMSIYESATAKYGLGESLIER